jgi:hypothetical protein
MKSTISLMTLDFREKFVQNKTGICDQDSWKHSYRLTCGLTMT